MRNIYIYDGPVKEFGTIVAKRWKGETVAVSEKKAKSNLAYQYKRTHNKSSDSNITLPGKVKVVRKDDYDGYGF